MASEYVPKTYSPATRGEIGQYPDWTLSASRCNIWKGNITFVIFYLRMWNLKRNCEETSDLNGDHVLKKKKKLLEFVKSQYRQLEVNQKSSPYFKEKRERLLMWLWILLLSFQGQGLEHSFSITEESGAWSQACSAAWRRASSPVPFLFSLLFAGWLHGPNILLCTSLFTPTGKGLAFIWEINRALSHRCKR